MESPAYVLAYQDTAFLESGRRCGLHLVADTPVALHGIGKLLLTQVQAVVLGTKLFAAFTGHGIVLRQLGNQAVGHATAAVGWVTFFGDVTHLRQTQPPQGLDLFVGGHLEAAHCERMAHPAQIQQHKHAFAQLGNIDDFRRAVVHGGGRGRLR